MTKELPEKSVNDSLPEHVLETLDEIPSIFSRIEIVLKEPLKVIDKKKLQKIETRLKEINEKMYNFGKRDSNITRKLLTLQMLDTADSTFRVLRQILAQIERKQQSISEAYVNLKKEYVEIVRLQEHLKKQEDPIEKGILEAEIQSKVTNLSNTFVYLEAALKEIGLLQDAYEQIKKNKGIPDDWDELDFEQAEIEAHIRNAFRNGIRDYLSSGTLNWATCEYLEQLGISPLEGIFHITNYINRCNEKLNEVQSTGDLSKLPDYDDFHDFLSEMARIYKNAYKKACKRLGIDEVISKDFILISARNKKQLIDKEFDND